MNRPRIGVYGLTSCAGDQLALLNCEDELLDIVGAVDLRSFTMAQSGPDETQLDIAFVEGSVAQPRDLDRLREIRGRARLLVAIGTCAVWGGVAAGCNEISRAELCSQVYGQERPAAKDGFFVSLPVGPLADHVKVDLAIPGCPVEKDQLLNTLASLLHGDLPLTPRCPVCAECKMRENVCLLLRDGMMCCGPLTVGGCQARCPSFNRPCLGCRGPIDDVNVAAEYRLLLDKGHAPEDILNRLRTFAAAAHLECATGDVSARAGQAEAAATMDMATREATR